MSSAWIAVVVNARRTPSGDVRTALVDAAQRVLERNGVAGLTVRAVATEAGVAPMGVYNHLRDKDGLIVAVLQRGFAGLLSAVTPQAGIPIAERLPAAGRSYRRFALANPVTYALMFNSAHPTLDVTQVVPEAAPSFLALVDLVAAGQRAGVVRAGAPENLALSIWASVHGAVSLELTGNLHGTDDADESFEQLLAMITRGMAPD